MMKNKKIGVMVRILIIIAPLILSFFFLFSPFEIINLTREKITEKMTIVKVSSDELFKPSFRNAIRDILQVPFNLKWYSICFVNRGTKIIYGDNIEEDYNINVTLNFNENQSIFEVPLGETKCVSYKLDKDFTYNWMFDAIIDLRKIRSQEPKKICINETHCVLQFGEGRIHPDVDSYAKPEFNSIIVKNILVLISWCSLIWLYTRIRMFILKGKNF